MYRDLSRDIWVQTGNLFAVLNLGVYLRIYIGVDIGVYLGIYIYRGRYRATSRDICKGMYRGCRDRGNLVAALNRTSPCTSGSSGKDPSWRCRTPVDQKGHA